jgi:hypothetical protein
VPRARFKLAESELAEDRDTVGPVEGDRADVEDTGDSSVGAETNKVDGDTEEDRDPDGVQRCASQGTELGPDRGHWQEAVTREGENGAGGRLHGCETNELDDYEAAYSEEDTARLAETVVEELGNGLGEWGDEDLGRITLSGISMDMEMNIGRWI